MRAISAILGHSPRGCVMCFAMSRATTLLMTKPERKTPTMTKQLVFDEEARRSLKKGIDILASAVKTTLGPKGRNVALDQKFGAPSVTHDGVTVAKEIQLENPFENMGAQLRK